MNKRNSKFIPKLKSAFDFPTLEEMRQALNALLNGKMVQGGSDDVLYADGNTIWQYQRPSTQEAYFPFKIYQPSNVSSFTTGITFLDPSSGVGTVCNISTNPTDFTAIPPNVNIKETWRFWSVRSGQVELRTIYNLLETGSEYYSPFGDLISDPDNFAWKYTVGSLTDGISPSANNVPFDEPTDKTIYPPLIINDNNILDDGSVSLMLWLQMTQDTAIALPTIIVAGVQPASYPAYSQWPQVGTLSIPIGVISTGFIAESEGYVSPLPVVEQFIFDHQVNLFPRGRVATYGYGAMSQRGMFYSVNDIYNPPLNCYPTDLESQVVYPGDVFSFAYFVGNGASPATYSSDLYQYIYPYPEIIGEIGMVGVNATGPGSGTGGFYEATYLSRFFTVTSTIPPATLP